MPSCPTSSARSSTGATSSGTAPLDFQRLKKRHAQGDLKLIVIDPRKTEAGRFADIWVQLRPGTDTALFMAWINVIIEEGLYDKDFVENWTFGFDELRARAAEYTPEKVAEITWVPADVIRASARMYATNGPAGFHWGCATDMFGLNSIRVEQARICLRALTGNLAVGGGEVIVGPGPIVDGKLGIRDSMLALPEKVSPEQRAKQLGNDRFKLLGWLGYEAMYRYHEETYGVPFPTAAHNFVAVQPLIWKAVLEKDPYPVTAMITWGSNVLLNGGDVKTIYKALKSPNLELHVVMEHFMTPTAMLADYVLPIASKFEKPMCATHEDFASNIACSEAAIEPRGERRGDYHVWKGLAERLGFGEYFPWKTEEELADYRLAPLGKTFHQVATSEYFVRSDEPWTYATINPRTGKPTGFATPSGKVELYSNVLKELGYDPLPYYEEPPESPVRTPELAKEYPYILITGGNFRPMFHSENRQLGIGTREQYPDPVMDVNTETAEGPRHRGRRLGVRRDPQGRHQAAGLGQRRDRPAGGQRAESLVVPRGAGPRAVARRALGVELQRAHSRRRLRHVRPGDRRLAAPGLALQDLQGRDGGARRGRRWPARDLRGCRTTTLRPPGRRLIAPPSVCWGP